MWFYIWTLWTRFELKYKWIYIVAHCNNIPDHFQKWLLLWKQPQNFIKEQDDEVFHIDHGFLEGRALGKIIQKKKDKLKVEFKCEMRQQDLTQIRKKCQDKTDTNPWMLNDLVETKPLVKSVYMTDFSPLPLSPNSTFLLTATLWR